MSPPPPTLVFICTFMLLFYVSVAVRPSRRLELFSGKEGKGRNCVQECQRALLRAVRKYANYLSLLVVLRREAPASLDHYVQSTGPIGRSYCWLICSWSVQRFSSGNTGIDVSPKDHCIMSLSEIICLTSLSFRRRLFGRREGDPGIGFPVVASSLKSWWR